MPGKFDRASAHGGTPVAGDLTRAELLQIYPRIDPDLRNGRVTEATVTAYLAALNEAWRLLGIDTVQAQAGFLAHAAVESDQFRKLTETQSWRQDWAADPTRIRLDTQWLNNAAANPRYRAYQMGGSINPQRDPTWQSSYIGRGAVQVTHQNNYSRVVAYLREAARRRRAAGDAATAERLEACAQGVAADPRQAAHPQHVFLFSTAYMKEVEGDRMMAGVGASAPFTGGGAESRWVTGGATELPDRATGKSQAYARAHPLLGRRATAAAPAAQALAQSEALEAELGVLVGSAQQWQAHAQALDAQVVQAMAQLGEINLPEPVVPPRDRQVLALLASLYLVNELEPLMRAAERIASLWSSGAVQVALPQLEPLLARLWSERRLRLSGDERRNLLALAFAPQEFEPAMRRLCEALVALADNARQRDVREEVGLQHAAQAVLELAGLRIEGVVQQASSELLAQLREATQLLSDRTLQGAFGVHDLPGLVRACLVTEPAVAQGVRNRIDRARAGSAVLQWLAAGAAGGFAVNPRDAGLQAVLMAAQRWLLASPQPAVAAA
jgi:predicted chitinase